MRLKILYKPIIFFTLAMLSGSLTGCFDHTAQSLLPNGSDGRSLVHLFNEDTKEPLTCKEVLETYRKNRSSYTAVITRNGVRWELEYHPEVCRSCLGLPDRVLLDSLQKISPIHHENSSSYVLRAYATEKNSARSGTIARISHGLITEIIGRDTIPCAFLHLETLPAEAPFHSAIVGFLHNEQLPGERRVAIRDDEHIWGGDLLFSFPSTLIF